MDTSKSALAKVALGLAGVLALLAAAAVLYVLLAPASKPAGGGYAQYAVGGMARLIVLETPPPMAAQALFDAAGQEKHLSDYRGQVMVVNYWATWCAPCMEEMPTLGALQRRYQGRIRIIPVSVDDDANKARAEAELARLSGGALPFLIEPTRAIIFDAQSRGMPTSILYDAQGVELARVNGRADWVSPEAIQVIELALAGAR